ncbi:hypothetical protein [Cellulomonas sp. IC4_254]|uniref:hypothetical protein n=1 Tax=Cellulomonas sp. IC4_254 TaxID=2714040 RepID=UPI00141E9415|nr:hypothetical protein [Cellulomonas sp. IC4_254]NHT17438.1 hypothetical protein [Cellulomonas sp. IC4_254]
MATASVVQDEDGRVTEHREELEPARAAADLPVRVQTAWWHDGTSGTDLADLDGRSGRFVVQVAVQDLTAEPRELAFETHGARYRQQALVGVPFTVVASATVGAGDRVVQVDDGSGDDPRVTDGVLVETTEGDRSVQWAAFLAAPMLSPTADFTLVVESQDFRAPSFDLTVQPGLVTDPSVGALIDRAYGADGYAVRQEGAAIALVQRVGRSLAEALDFVDQVHEALVQDVAHVGERTYGSLGASSEAVLDHLARTAEDLDAVLVDARSGLGQVGTETRRGVQDLSRSVSDVLGPPGVRPTLSETVVAGCTVTMPTLAESEARTVSATVHLADAQLRAVADLFADGRDAPSASCRTELHQLVLGTVGDPATVEHPDGVAACLATPEDHRTIACTLAVARSALGVDLAVLAAGRDEVRAVADRLDVAGLTGAVGGADGLAASLTALREELVAARSGSSGAADDLAGWALRVGGSVDDARAGVALARDGLETTASAVEGLRRVRDEARVALSDPDHGPGAVLAALDAATDAPGAPGAWFLASGYVEAFDDLAGDLAAGACPAGWADDLGPDSSAGDVAQALDRFDVAGCPLGDLAGAVADLVVGYGGAATTVSALVHGAATARTALGAVERAFDALDTAVDELAALTDPTGSLAQHLLALDDPDRGTGTLAVVAGAVEEVASLVVADGGLHDLDARLEGLVTLVTAIWPDDTVQPLVDAGACTSPRSSAVDRPGASAQMVVRHANRLLCLEADLDARLHDLDHRLDEVAGGSDARLALASGRTQDAADRAHDQIDLLASGLVAEVTAQRQEATAGSQALVTEARTRVRAEMDAVLADYDLAASGVLQQLTDAMQRSGAQSIAAATALGGDFADLQANLGSPDPTSRGGLLGKLHSITTRVGDTGGVLDSVHGTTTAYGNVRSGELRDLDLRAAQFAAAEARLAGYRPFAEVSEDLETVFVLQVRGDR